MSNQLCRMISIGLFFLVVRTFRDVPQCFDSPSTLKYTNTQNSYIKHIKVFSGYWGSQSALSLILYIFLKEKIGYDLTFWPQDSAISPTYETLISYIAETTNLEAEPYWNAWIRGFEEFDVDIVGEWYNEFSRDNRTLSYIFNEFQDGPQTGTNVRMGYFVPEYAITDELICPYYLDLWANDTMDLLRNENFTKIPIWAASDSYAMVRRGKALLESTGLSEVYEVLSMGSENLLTAKIDDLVSRNESFVAIVYTPHLDFSRYALRPLHFPFNPSGKWSDPCVQEYSCGWVDDPVTYRIRESLVDTWPEVIEALRNLEITRTMINDILGDYDTTGNMGLSVCNWAKSNEALLDAAIVYPERYEWIDGKWEKAITHIFTIIPSCCIFLIVLFLIWYTFNWNSSLILSTSPSITVFWFFGHILLFSHILVVINGLKSSQQAFLYNVTLNIGLAMVLLAPTFRSYRISKIFDDDLKDRSNHLTTQSLVVLFTSIIFLEAILSIGFVVTYPMFIFLTTASQLSFEFHFLAKPPFS